MSIRIVNHVYIADTARVLGDVTIAQDVNIWYGVSIRGDVAPITIGEQTNIQDNVVIHCDTGYPNHIGRRVSIGHGAVVHGESVGDETLIGMHATVMGHVRIGKRCVIAAGAVVPPGLQVPDGMMVMGVPGRVIRPVNKKEQDYLDLLPDRYLNLAKRHHESPDAPTVRPFGCDG